MMNTDQITMCRKENKAMKTARQIEKKYEVMQYDRHEVTARSVTADELLSIEPRKFNHYISTRDRIYGFRSRSGKWIKHRKRWPRMGPISKAILRALQLNPGEFLSPDEIAELTGRISLREHDVLTARIYAIRKAHDDSGDWFIETTTDDGYAVRWREERTWLWIDRIPSAPQV